MSTLGMFTKLIVADEEVSATYYEAVYGMKVVQRIQGETDGELFREVLLAADGIS